MTTVADAIGLTRRRLRSTYRRKVNLLASITGPTLTLTHPIAGISAGSLIAVGVEVMYVVSADVGARRLTVIRGYEATDVIDHAPGDIIDVEPRFPDAFILDELRAEVLSWGPELFRVAETTVDGDSHQSTAALSVDGSVYQLLDVVVSPTTGDTSLRPTRLIGALVRSADVDVWPTGLALALDQPPGLRRVTVTYATSFEVDPFDLDTDLVDQVGLAPSMVDLLVLGAAYRSLTEVPRTDRSSVGEQRDAEEVPPGHITSVREDLNRERSRRRNEEIIKLRARYPVRST